ncbi:MAG: adenylyltransferase/cytidyltransferase family protein [Anaerolineaceae bacterium]|nr:adenylyltransferase/cytidyltransferase family protein [Anaerolineaceae bacterium]
MAKKVFVSGCFDLLHSGHVTFLEEAASYGDLYVAVASDKTFFDLKGRTPVNSEQERLYMIQALGCVKQAMISHGSGMLDFSEEFIQVQPDLLIVNEDGNLNSKLELCRKHGVDYLVLQRTQRSGLAARSSTALRKLITMPFRIDIAGGWLDQPYVSKHYPGPVVTISIEPTVEFNNRSGMASSTRHKALDLWGPRLPQGDPEKLARVLFCYDNPPGTPQVSGSQDAIGIVFPGLNIAHYEGDYWPSRIESINDELTLQFIEKSISMVPLGPRGPEYDVLSQTRIDRVGAKALADAALGCWDAILRQDIREFGRFFREAFEAQIAMFPLMMNETVSEMIERYRDQALGWKLSGAGGGGYLILISDTPIEHAFHVNIRRKSD